MLSILYRGPSASCNYGCDYCTLAKGCTDAGQLADRDSLARFTDWIERRAGAGISVFFTPAGEALIRPWYQQAIARLTCLPGIVRVVAQTNLSCDLSWLRSCKPSKLALWCTYHPHFVLRSAFLEQCQRLSAQGVRFSVGMVGMREHLAECEQMRHLLPPAVYLWINAYKHQPAYYSPAEVRRLSDVDPLFPWSLGTHPSRGRFCRTGDTVIAVDGQGTIRRCHFVEESLGNIDQADWRQALRPRPCPNADCRCHIGYVHLAHLQLDAVFGDGILERIPAYVSKSGEYSSGSSNPAIQAAALRQSLVSGGTRIK